MSPLFSIDQVAARARSRTRLERSEARMLMSQPGSPSRSTIASENGSSPLDEAALQAVRRRGRRPSFASAIQAGQSESFTNEKCFGLRKNQVSFVEMAS